MEIPIPFTNQTIEADDGKGVLYTIAALVVGFMVFALSRDVGERLASLFNDAVSSATGVNPTGDESSADNPEVV
jgi:hypothetical protein